MALNLLDATTLSLGTPGGFATNTRNVRGNRGYLFSIRTSPADLIETGLMVLCIPTYIVNGRAMEAPLAAKFYPKGLEMFFGAVVPRANGDFFAPMGLLLILKKTRRTTPNSATLPVEISFDQEQIPLNESNFPSQS